MKKLIIIIVSIFVFMSMDVVKAEKYLIENNFPKEYRKIVSHQVVNQVISILENILDVVIEADEILYTPENPNVYMLVLDEFDEYEGNTIKIEVQKEHLDIIFIHTWKNPLEKQNISDKLTLALTGETYDIHYKENEYIRIYSSYGEIPKRVLQYMDDDDVSVGTIWVNNYMSLFRRNVNEYFTSSALPIRIILNDAAKHENISDDILIDPTKVHMSKITAKVPPYTVEFSEETIENKTLDPTNIFGAIKLPEINDKLNLNDGDIVFEEHTYGEIMRDRNGLRGQNIKITGKILQYFEKNNKGFGLIVKDSETYIIVFESLPNSRLLEGDFVTVYGQLEGLMDYKTAGDFELTVPAITVSQIEIEGIDY